jgi:hypothetical protein
MTKKDKINWLLMAPFLLVAIGACLYAVVNLMVMQPLGLLALVVVAAFVIGFIRFMEIEDD